MPECLPQGIALGGFTRHAEGMTMRSERSGTRHATRDLDRAWVGGVCAGLAANLRVPVLVLRVMFLVLGVFGFYALLIYAAMWLLLPVEQEAEEAAGLAANRRSGMRLVDTMPANSETGLKLAMAVLAVGMALLFSELSWLPSWESLAPIWLSAFGLALVWRQVDAANHRGRISFADWWRPRGIWVLGQIIVGLLSIVAAVTLVSSGVGTPLGAPTRVATVVVAMLTVGIILAPIWHQTRQALSQAQEARVRADLRADVAAHLHDSVLQTFALIQQQADDPNAVARLARIQERELREWLYGPVEASGSLGVELRATATEIEAEFPVQVEVVTSGDVEEGIEPLVAAAAEAMRNAARHSGADKIDVFAEVTPEAIEVFVRDRGCGFDPGSIPPDRHGLRDSIEGRMARHEGTAVVRSDPEFGTEVRLKLERR